MSLTLLGRKDAATRKPSQRLARAFRTPLLLAVSLMSCEFTRTGTGVDFVLSLLELYPPTVSIQPHAAVDFTVFGVDTDGDTVVADVSWEAERGTFDETGMKDGKRYARYRAGADTGRVRVIAKNRGRSLADTAIVIIAEVSVASVTVSPPSASLSVGGSTQLVAVPRDQSGTLLGGRTVTWSSSASGVAAVNNTGVVSGVAAGSATITATVEGRSGTSAITVTAAPAPPPPPPPPPPGCQVSSTSWANTPFGAQNGSFTATFDATPNAAGMDGVIALSAGSVSANSGMAVTVRFNPDGEIDARNGSSYTSASTINYVAGTRYRFRLVVDVAGHSYSAYVTPTGGTEQTIGTGLSFRTEQSTVTSLANLAVQANSGTHQVCDFAITGSAPPAPVASVTVTPSSASVGVGTATQLTATPRNASGGALSGRVITWASANTAIATVNTTGRVTGVALGTVTITATSEGKSGSAEITVTAAPPPPPPPPPGGGGLPVVPGIEGHGSTTTAGRGGTVLRVTNLNDAGPGSLREALQASGPRVVIFEISGTIVVSSDIQISNPYVTVAGQTAPSPGIMVRGAALRVNTHDVLIQHLRIRAGDDPGGPSPSGRDALGVYGSNVYNVVIDHVSASWGIDENASTSTAGTRHDITFINSIISEGLSNAGHGEGEHSKGLLIGQGSTNISIIRSIFAHNRDRNPYFKGNSFTLFVNNIAYNYGHSYAIENGDGGGYGPQQSSQVGNVFIAGANTPSGRPIRVHSSVKPGSLIYVADNSFNRAVPADPWSIVEDQVGASIRASTPPIWTSLTVLPNAQVESWVLANAGARPADRDAVDTRIVNQIRNNTGQIIDSPSQVGGWPVLAVNTRALTVPANPSGDTDGDGYTNLEEWLHQYSAQVE